MNLALSWFNFDFAFSYFLSVCINSFCQCIHFVSDLIYLNACRKQFIEFIEILLRLLKFHWRLLKIFIEDFSLKISWQCVVSFHYGDGTSEFWTLKPVPTPPHPAYYSDWLVTVTFENLIQSTPLCTNIIVLFWKFISSFMLINSGSLF